MPPHTPYAPPGGDVRVRSTRLPRGSSAEVGSSLFIQPQVGFPSSRFHPPQSPGVTWRAILPAHKLPSQGLPLWGSELRRSTPQPGSPSLACPAPHRSMCRMSCKSNWQNPCTEP